VQSPPSGQSSQLHCSAIEKVVLRYSVALHDEGVGQFSDTHNDDPLFGCAHPDGQFVHTMEGRVFWSWNIPGWQSWQIEPAVLLNFPLSQGSQFVAPRVLDSPASHFVHFSFGGSLPIVPAGQALNPDGSDSLIFDPFGTITDADPPAATILPAGTSSQFACSSFDWR
jgi:hypothetical protein